MGMNPKPEASQVKVIKAARVKAMKALDKSFSPENLQQIELLDAWLYAYVTGPHAYKKAS